MPAIILNSYAPNLTPAQQHEWQDKAKCAEIVDDTTFFPEEYSGYKKAIKICEQCEVINECLAYALKTEPPYRDRHGVFGGKTPNERRLMAGERFVRTTVRRRRQLMANSYLRKVLPARS